MPFFLFPSESLFDVGSLANASQDLATKSRIIFHVLASLQRPNQYTLPRFKKTTTSDTSESCLFFFFLSWGKNISSIFKRLNRSLSWEILQLYLSLTDILAFFTNNLVDNSSVVQSINKVVTRSPHKRSLQSTEQNPI